MKAVAGTLALFALFGATAGAIAGNAPANSGSSSSATTAPTVSDNLNKLIRANLQEAANLRAEVNSLGDNHAAKFVWLVMVQEYTYDANILAIAEHEMGGKLEHASPVAAPAKGDKDELIKAALERQEDLLKTVKASEPGASGKALSAMRHVEGAVQKHIERLRTLAAGLPITGA